MPPIERIQALGPWVAGLAAFAVYWKTGAPGAWWGDGQELACAAWGLGIPHPTGYPLYMVAAHAAMKAMGWLDPGRALTVFSALLLAVSVGLLVPIFQNLIHNHLGPRTASSALPFALPAVGCALLIAFARTVWEHGTFAEVYPLTFLISVLILALAITEPKTESGLGRAAGLGFLFGLGLLNHYSILAFGPLVFLCVLRGSLRARGGWRLPLAATGACALALTGYLYLPLRAAANPPLNWGDPSNWERFKWVLSGGQFKQIMVGASPDSVRYGLANWLAWWSAQWWGVSWDRIITRQLNASSMTHLMILGGMITVSAAAGLIMLARRRWDLGLGLLGVMAATAVFAAFYHIPDIAAYFMIALPAAMIGLICLVTQRVRNLQPISVLHIRHPGILMALPLIIAIFLVVSAWVPVDKSWDDGPARYGEAVLKAAKPGALIVTTQGALADAEIYSLWYQQMVLGQRKDVTVYGSGFMFMGWYAKYFEAAGRPRIPVYVEPRPLGNDELYFFVKLFKNILLPNLAQGRQVLVTYRHGLFSEYLDPRPVAIPLPESYAGACAFVCLPGPVIYELHPNPRLAQLDERALMAEFGAYAKRRAAGPSF